MPQGNGSAKDWGVRIAVPDARYRQLKIEAAMRGMTIAQCAVDLIGEALAALLRGKILHRKKAAQQ